MNVRSAQTPERITSVVEAFGRQVELRPDAAATVGGRGGVSYRELHRLAQRQAVRLQARGVQRGDVVAIWSDNATAETIAVLLAVLMAGAGYVCLDDRYPSARIAMMLEDSGAHLAVTDADRATRLPGTLDVIEIGDLSKEATDPARTSTARNPGRHTVEVGSLDLAYVGFTSGSTGRPRGAAITHDAVLRLAMAPKFVSISEGDVVGAFSSMAFDASTLEIWGALLNGAAVALKPAEQLSVSALTAAIRRMDVTVLWLTSSFFHQVVDSGELATCTSLRHVLAGGDAVSPRHVGLALEQCAGVTVTNGYGPTENTTFTTTFSTQTPLDGDTTPIGWPIPGTGVRILDDNGDPVPDGADGELYATGRGLAYGYLGRGGATAERFVPDPYSNSSGARMYRTGDRVRQLPDGCLQFLGRVDNQVKVRGFRVELDEVANALSDLDDVAHSTVFRRERGAGPATLAAAVTLGPSAKTTPAALRKQLTDFLPDYAVPSGLVVVDDFPLTSSGKVDHDALRNRLGTRRDNLSTPYAEPEDDLQQSVTDTWVAHLNTSPIGIDDEFFEIGGHSLVAVAIIAELQARFGVEVSPRAFYSNPTPRGMATAIAVASEQPC